MPYEIHAKKLYEENKIISIGADCCTIEAVLEFVKELMKEYSIIRIVNLAEDTARPSTKRNEEWLKPRPFTREWK